MIKLPRSFYTDQTPAGLATALERTNKAITTYAPNILVRLHQRGLTSAIPTATLYFTRTEEQGIYAVAADLITTTAGAAGTGTLTLGWNNGTAAQTAASAGVNLANAGAEDDFFRSFFVGPQQTVTYAVGLVGGAGTKYSLDLVLLALG